MIVWLPMENDSRSYNSGEDAIGGIYGDGVSP